MSSKIKRTASKARSPAGKGAAQPQEDQAKAAAEQELLLQHDRLQQMHAQLEASQAAFGHLCEEHQRLQDLRRHEERVKLFELFRRQMLSKNEQLGSLQADVSAAQQRLQEAQAAAAQRETQLQQGFEQERQQLGAQVAVLQAQLQGLQQFQQDKEGLEAELARLRQENAQITEDSGEKVRALQRRLYELGYGYDGMGEGPADSGPAEEQDEGQLHLEADLHRLLVHSRKVEDEMKHYGQEAEELQKEMKALECERAALVRDVKLKDEMEKQYATRSTLQAREIRDAHSRIGTLERGLAQMAADFEVEKTGLEEGLRAQLAQAVDEQNGLRRLLRLRTRELRTLRRLAQEVLLQRSDVESFLVSSIQQVRRQMAAAAAAAAAQQQQQQQAQQQQGQRQGGSLAASPTAAQVAPGTEPSSTGVGWGPSASQPPASSQHSPHMQHGPSRSPSRAAAGAPSGAAGTRHVNSAAQPAAGAAGQVDIKDLSWEDRERILRLLFAKINKAAQQPKAPKQQPAQTTIQVQAAAPLPLLRGLATEAGPAGLA